MKLLNKLKLIHPETRANLKRAAMVERLIMDRNQNKKEAFRHGKNN